MGDYAFLWICCALFLSASKFLGLKGVPAIAGGCVVKIVEATTALSLTVSKFCRNNSLTGFDLVLLEIIVFLRALLNFRWRKTLVAGGF